MTDVSIYFVFCFHCMHLCVILCVYSCLFLNNALTCLYNVSIFTWLERVRKHLNCQKVCGLWVELIAVIKESYGQQCLFTSSV